MDVNFQGIILNAHFAILMVSPYNIFLRNILFTLIIN